ncbi:SIR2 family protein [Maricaulis sp.]|uniref:P-loop NTPase n=1 Tax=Maricaulis sp. TaxID=1486257 RepID=UPI003A90A8EC
MNPSILSAFNRGKLILVLGAGCSLESENQFGDKMLSGPGLAKALGERFGLEISEEESKALPKVVQAILANNSRDEVYTYTRDLYKCKNPSSDHMTLGQIPFQRVYVTNYDDSVEMAYIRAHKQQISTYRIGDPVVALDPLFSINQIIKIHGCTNDPNNALIYSLDDYAATHGALPKWYNQLATDCFGQTVVFVGNTMDEPLLFDALGRVSTKTTVSSCFVVTPSIPNLDKISLEKRGFKHVPGTFSDLLDTLKAAGATTKQPIDMARSASPELDALLKMEGNQAREDTVQALTGITPMQGRDANRELPAGIRPFYEGFKPDWVDIDSGVTADLEHDLVVRNTISLASRSPNTKLVAVIGPAGTGKTTTLMKAARALSGTSDKPSFWASDDIEDPLQTIRFLERSHPDGYVLYLPSGSDFSANIEHGIRNNIIVSGTIALPFYKNAWQSKFRDNFDRDTYEVVELGNISELDAANILTKLQKFGPWTRLAKMNQISRLSTLYGKSQKQLLIGLIETTNGLGFPEIIRRDLLSLGNTAAKSLTILSALCTMLKHGLPLPVAMEAISTLHPGTDFNESLVGTTGICALRNNTISARHPIYARTLVVNIADRSDLLEKLITLVKTFSRYGTPVPKHSERSVGQLFKSLINFRFVKQILFDDKDMVGEFYRNLETEFPSDGAFWLQYGLSKRSFGEHEEALKLLNRSLDAYGESRSNFTNHALGLQHFILSERSPDPSLSLDHMNIAVEILSKLEANDAFDDLYPLTTLATGHIRCLYKLHEPESARIQARNYYDRIDSFIRTGITNRKLVELRKELLTFYTTGEYTERFWARPFWSDERA